MAKALHSLMRKAALAVLLLLGLAAPSMAATLYISEFPNAISQVGSTSPQVYPQAALTDQTVALSGSSALSSAFGTSTRAVILICDEGCSVKFGSSSVTAATTNFLLQQGVPYPFSVSSGTYVAAIANAAGNTGGGSGEATNATIVAPLGQKVSASSVSVALSSDGGQATAANQTNASQKTQIVDGSGNVAGSQSFAGSANFLNVTTPDELPFTGTLSAAGVIPVSINGGATQAFIDTTGYESVTFQVNGAASTTTQTFQTSDDNSTWFSMSCKSVGSLGATAQTSTTTATGIFVCPKTARYVRDDITAYGSGTVTIAGGLHKDPQTLPTRVTVDGSVVGGASNVTTTGGFPSYFAAFTSNPVAVGTGRAVNPIATTLGVAITKSYSGPWADWTASVSLSTTGSTALQAAGGAGVRNYLTAIQFSGNAALVANTIQVLDGVTVIWGPHTIPAATPFMQIVFPTPLRTSAAAALNVQIGTTPVGALEVTGQGYQSAEY